MLEICSSDMVLGACQLPSGANASFGEPDERANLWSTARIARLYELALWGEANLH
jgi:hypothetical protein